MIVTLFMIRQDQYKHSNEMSVHQYIAYCVFGSTVYVYIFPLVSGIQCVQDHISLFPFYFCCITQISYLQDTQIYLLLFSLRLSTACHVFFLADAQLSSSDLQVSHGNPCLCKVTVVIHLSQQQFNMLQRLQWLQQAAHKITAAYEYNFLSIMTPELRNNHYN